jgi:hypothetical protein
MSGRPALREYTEKDGQEKDVNSAYSKALSRDLISRSEYNHHASFRVAKALSFICK